MCCVGRQWLTSCRMLSSVQVNYVGKAVNLYEDAGYKLNGSAYVIEKHLGTSWLWDKVRVVGGAYGGFCSFDSHSGMFTFLSYRGKWHMMTEGSMRCCVFW